MLKPFFMCAGEIETQTNETNMARSVLREVAEYFEYLDERPSLIVQADHILNLIHVVEILLTNIHTSLTDTAKTMYETYNEVDKQMQKV